MTNVFGTVQRFLLGERLVLLFNGAEVIYDGESNPAHFQAINQKIVTNVGDKPVDQVFWGNNSKTDEKRTVLVKSQKSYLNAVLSVLTDTIPVIPRQDTVFFVSRGFVNSLINKLPPFMQSTQQYVLEGQKTPSGTNYPYIVARHEGIEGRIPEIYQFLYKNLQEWNLHPSLLYYVYHTTAFWRLIWSWNVLSSDLWCEPQKTFKKLWPKNFQKSFKDFEKSKKVSGNDKRAEDFLKQFPLWEVKRDW